MLALAKKFRRPHLNHIGVCLSSQLQQEAQIGCGPHSLGIKVRPYSRNWSGMWLKG
jgi:hypothetical protein